jgi:hypothetical protein
VETRKKLIKTDSIYFIVKSFLVKLYRPFLCQCGRLWIISFYYRRPLLFVLLIITAVRKTGKTTNNVGGHSFSLFMNKLVVMVFVDSKRLWNVTPANSEGNLYFSIMDVFVSNYQGKYKCDLYNNQFVVDLCFL